MWLIMLLLLAIFFIVVSSARYDLHPFLALIFAALGFGLLSGAPPIEVVKALNGGFGETIGKIGIVILAGTVIGVFLEKSGGAYSLAESILRLTGERNVPLAMSAIGYIVSIPVFCDSGFVILSSLNRALSKRAGISLAVSSVALSLGLYATHTMVPPTPGPMAAAGLMKADLGLVIGYGMFVSLFAALSGWIYSLLFASRVFIDPEPEESQEDIQQKLETAPPAFFSLLPVLIPIVLIVLNSYSAMPTQPLGSGWMQKTAAFLGEPVVALAIGMLLAFGLPRRLERSMFSTSGWVGQALSQASIIILVTGAGGAFAKVLQTAGVDKTLGATLQQWNLGIWLPFIISAAIKTAQGSSTVAMITTASLLQPLSASLGFDTPHELALAVVMIGAGSMVVSHLNDSYFWVVTQLSRMDVGTGCRVYSPGTVVQGLVAGVVGWVLYVGLAAG